MIPKIVQPVLPPGLRHFWRDLRLPEWVSKLLEIDNEATFQSLDGTHAKSLPVDHLERVTTGLTFHLARYSERISDLPFFIDAIPPSMKIEEMKLSSRTSNALLKAGLSGGIELQKVTIGGLLGMSGFGTRSLLDLASGFERYKASLPSHQLALIKSISNQTSSPGGTQMQKNSQIQTTILEHDLEVALSLLRNVVHNDWTSVVSERDPRFLGLLPAGSGTFEERFAWLAESPGDNARELIALSESIAPIQERMNDIAKTPLIGAFINLVSNFSGVEGPMLEGLVHRFGVGGQPPLTLQAAGELAGRTRERMRQVESRTRSRMPEHPLFMPQLTQLVNTISYCLPISVENSLKIASDNGLTKVDVHPASVIAMAEFCGSPVANWGIFKVGKQERVAVKSDHDVRSILKIANDLSNSSGVSNAYIVAAELENRTEIDVAEIIDILKGHSRAEFLEGPWFWNPEKRRDRNRLRNVTRRILSVTRAVSLGDIRIGVVRVYKFRNSSGSLKYELIAPPISILRRFYTAHPEFEIISDHLVRSVEELDYRQELGTTEQTFVDVLRSVSSGVIERQSFAESCLKLGMNENTFNLYTSYSPVLEHVDVDVWALRGVNLDLAAVRAVQQANSARPRSKRVVDATWTPEGNLRIAARLPSLMENFVLGIPAGFKDYLTENSYPALDRVGRSCGSIGVSREYMLYGFGAYLRRSGADENDILSIEFNLVDQTVVLQLLTDDQELDFD